MFTGPKNVFMWVLHGNRFLKWTEKSIVFTIIKLTAEKSSVLNYCMTSAQSGEKMQVSFLFA